MEQATSLDGAGWILDEGRLRTFSCYIALVSTETQFHLSLAYTQKNTDAMGLQQLVIDLPADILLTLNESETDVKQRILQSLAIQLYQEEKVTIGKAAQVAGISRLAFETLLAKHKIPISLLSAEEVFADANKLKQ